ncbi:MAG: hypothetical protein ACD_45C00234G0002 [uncultured bacterium]|nr:MAG: hypothetical protein ACD_45C00234G0002 [uncultured bacterium]OGT57987.1 MAG: hypothetical protein A3F43_06965 [Gammaproteobacteria bacterium RIFCSPHIGHO2_12_FULL_42_10]
MKYEFMQAHEQEFSIERMSSVFNVSRSGYYGFIHAKPSARAQENERLHQSINMWRYFIIDNDVIQRWDIFRQ